MIYDSSDDDAWMGLKVVEEATTMGGPPLASPPPALHQTIHQSQSALHQTIHQSATRDPPANHKKLPPEPASKSPNPHWLPPTITNCNFSLISKSFHHLQNLITKCFQVRVPTISTTNFYLREKVLVWFEPPSIIPGNFLLPILLPLWLWEESDRSPPYNLVQSNQVIKLTHKLIKSWF